MRNNRGEWDYRESFDSDNYKFVRNSGIKKWELDSGVDKWDEVKWVFIAFLFTVAMACVIGFGLGYLVGEV